MMVSSQNHIGTSVLSENKFVVAERFCGYPKNFFVVEMLENPTSKMFEVFPKYFEAKFIFTAKASISEKIYTPENFKRGWH